MPHPLHCLACNWRLHGRYALGPLQNHRKYVVFSIIYICGCGLMSASSYPGVDSSWVFLVGLFLFVGLGSGGIKANVITLGGDQFDVIKPEEEVQQDSFFNYFYWVINLGALVSYGYLTQLSLLCRG